MRKKHMFTFGLCADRQVTSGKSLGQRPPGSSPLKSQQGNPWRRSVDPAEPRAVKRPNRLQSALARRNEFGRRHIHRGITGRIDFASGSAVTCHNRTMTPVSNNSKTILIYCAFVLI